MEEVRLIDANALHKRIEMNLHASNPFTIEECCYKDIDHIREEAYNTGYSEAEAQRAAAQAPGKTLPQLLEQLNAGECKGIKSATAYKIEEFARQQGYLE